MNFYTAILGCGSASPLPQRNSSAQIVNLNGSRILLDCAEGTQRQARFRHERLQGIDLVLITHLHGDHCLGLPGLISSLNNMGRKEPITLVGPKGLQQLMETCLRIGDVTLRFETQYVELDEGDSREVASAKRYRARCFPLKHVVPTFGYVIEEIPRATTLLTPRRYAYCLDTAYTESIIPHIAGADLLCHDSTFAADRTEKAALYGHSTAQQAATIAQKAGVRSLLLSHFSKSSDPRNLLAEAQAIFPNTRIAIEGDRVPITYRHDEED